MAQPMCHAFAIAAVLKPAAPPRASVTCARKGLASVAKPEAQRRAPSAACSAASAPPGAAGSARPHHSTHGADGGPNVPGSVSVSTNRDVSAAAPAAASPISRTREAGVSPKKCNVTCRSDGCVQLRKDKLPDKLVILHERYSMAALDNFNPRKRRKFSIDDTAFVRKFAHYVLVLSS